jgi:hypothetical protein
MCQAEEYESWDRLIQDEQFEIQEREEWDRAYEIRRQAEEKSQDWGIEPGIEQFYRQMSNALLYRPTVRKHSLLDTGFLNPNNDRTRR